MPQAMHVQYMYMHMSQHAHVVRVLQNVSKRLTCGGFTAVSPSLVDYNVEIFFLSAFFCFRKPTGPSTSDNDASLHIIDANECCR
jgi:hypothetical protein